MSPEEYSSGYCVDGYRKDLEVESSNPREAIEGLVPLEFENGCAFHIMRASKPGDEDIFQSVFTGLILNHSNRHAPPINQPFSVVTGEMKEINWSDNL